MGGISGPSGTTRALVGRRGVKRYLYPLIRASCSSEMHGAEFREASGNTVPIPALGDDRSDERRSGSDRDAGGQGRRDFPRAGFGGPRSPLRDGGCARGSGWDRLTGGDGPDTLIGGSGRNRYDAGAGNDVVRAANGVAELVSCGSGPRDRAWVDWTDRVRNCEIVRRTG